MRKQAKPAPENHTITVNFQEVAPMFACVRMVRRYSNGSLLLGLEEYQQLTRLTPTRH
jgi:hypothetical protein